MQIFCNLSSRTFSACIHPEHKPTAKEGILATINEERQTESPAAVNWKRKSRTRGGKRLLRSIDGNQHPDHSFRPILAPSNPK